MPGVQPRPATFFDLCKAGAVTEAAIDDFVAAPHRSGDDEGRALHEFLGLSWDE